MGFGTALTYAMYKPMAIDDEKKVSALLSYYRKVYIVVGIIITVAGACLTPFLGFFISGIPDIPELPAIYLLYLLNTSGSYFFIYKKSILISDQRNYISSIIFIICTIAQNIAQIICLVLTKNFVLYLSIQVIFTLINNFSVSKYVDKHYQYLTINRQTKLGNNDKNNIITNVKAMFLSKVSSAVVSSTDNILISKFVSTITLGIYSNYTLFTNILRTVITKLFEGIAGSVGNLVAVEDNTKAYKAFTNIWFVNYWIVGFSTSCLFILINPFISLWVGKDYLLQTPIVLMVCLNFYMRFIRNTFISFTDSYGLFVEFKVKCVAEAIINFVVSLIFVWNLKLGIFGILLGTFVSNITTNFWYEPYILYTKKFNVSLKKYYFTFIKYFSITIIGIIPIRYICNILNRNLCWQIFILELFICIVFINLIYYFFFHKSDEFEYFLSMIKKIIK